MIKRPLKSNEYLVPVSYEMSGFVSVIADSPEEAFQKVINDDGSCPLPDDPSYIDGSFTTSYDTSEMVQVYTDNYRNGQLNVELRSDGWQGPGKGQYAWQKR